MKFNKTLASMAAAAALLAAPLAAQAVVVFVDDFSVGFQQVSQLTVGTNSGTLANAPVAGFDRTLTVDVTSQGLDASNMTVAAGTLDLAGSNTGTFGVADYGLGYSGAGFAAYGPGTHGTVSFDLTSLDLIPFEVELLISSYTGTVISSIIINSLTVPSAYSVSGVGDFSSGFTLRFSGQSAYDFSLDNVTFTVPEPTSVGLAGLALLGLAAARRRKA